MINASGLSEELTAAGIQFSGCNSNGKVWDLENNEIQTRPDVAAIISAHNPSAWTSREQREKNRANSARSTAKNIPSWATWTQADWNTFFGNNLSDEQVDLVTNLAQAKAMMKRQNAVINNLAKIIIAMRDQIWPDLPE